MKILMGILFVFIAVVPFAGNAIGEQVYNVQIPTLAREHHLRSLALQTGTRLIAELHDCHSTRVFHRVFRFSSASRQEIYAAYFGPAKIKWSYNDAENILKVTDTRGEPPKQSFYGIALAELNFHPRNSHSLEYEFRRELDKSEEIQALLARTENAGGLVFHELNWDGWPIDDSEPVPQFAPPACFYFESCAVEDVVKRAFEIGHAKGVIFKSLCKHKECGDHAGGILYFFSRDVFNPRLDIRKQLRKARGPLSEYGYSRERHVLVTTLMFRLLTDERNTIRILEEDGIFQDDTVDLNLIKDELWAAIAQSGTELSQEFLIREFKKNKEGL